MPSEVSNATPPPGLVAGKYEILRLIGRGGMGSVWEGRHVSLNTRVAIKFIEAEYANSVDARQRFDNEARAAATIESKHAIQIYDHGMTEDGRPYIVMELLIGEPLDERLKQRGRLAPADTARLIHQVCRALHRAHERGIIHRDLKPENIFLVRHPDDDDDVAKVLDFGIAKIKTTPGATGISSSTKTGTLLGTPFYMSPEQARGLRNVDHRSDLWSLGVIVFRCITGVLPFDGESLGDLLVKICTVQVPVPSHVLPGLPVTLDAWVARALDREPDRRFQTANELAEHLAFACGVSVRRGGTNQHSPAPSDYGPGHEFGQTPPRTTLPMSASQARATAQLQSHPAYAQPIPPATSAPFTASSPRVAGSSKGLWFGVAGSLLVVSLVGGLYLFPKWLGAAKSAASASPTQDPPTSTAGIASSPPPPPPLVVLPPPSAPAATDPVPPPIPVTALPHPNSKLAPKPAGPRPAKPGVGSTTVQAPPVTNPLPPVPPSPKPGTAADQAGY